MYANTIVRSREVELVRTDIRLVSQSWCVFLLPTITCPDANHLDILGSPRELY